MTAAASATSDLERAWARLRTVMDPELPVVDIVGLGLVREVEIAGGTVQVTLTPTYSGCPALAWIEREVVRALEPVGPAMVRVVQAPAWTTDWISDEARAALAAAGIAPPPHAAAAAPVPPRCPRCDSAETERRSEFGATACKALWVCRACREPFELLKVI